MRQDILHEYRVKSQRRTENAFVSKQCARTRSKTTRQELLAASIGGASQESARSQFAGQPQQAGLGAPASAGAEASRHGAPGFICARRAARFRSPTRVTGPWTASPPRSHTHRCLTPRSTGAPTAGHQARAGGTRYIFACPGLAACRRLPVSSNVRPQVRTTVHRLRYKFSTRPHWRANILVFGADASARKLRW